MRWLSFKCISWLDLYKIVPVVIENHPRVGLDLVAVFCCPSVMPLLCQYNDIAGSNPGFTS